MGTFDGQRASWGSPGPLSGRIDNRAPAPEARVDPMTDWASISALATAGGTLVLALATFASVRSANRAARVAERSLLVGLRPLLLPSKLNDPPQKIGFVDDKWFLAGGGRGIAEADESAIYLAIPPPN